MKKTSKAWLWESFIFQYCRSLTSGLYLWTPVLSSGKDAMMFPVVDESDLSSDSKPPGCGAIRSALIFILAKSETM
jgi:hypothetical protein